MWKNIKSNIKSKIIVPLWRFLCLDLRHMKMSQLYLPNRRYSNIPKGLSYLPTLDPELSDTLDSYSRFSYLKFPPVEFSQRDALILLKELKRLGKNCRTILEIGVSRFNSTSSTKVIIDNKLQKTIYLGIDILDKSSVSNPSNNVYTIKKDSKNIGTVMNYLIEKGHSTIDLLIIDGDHSVEMAINDWKYTQYLSEHGVVIIHDTSVHPGPVVLYDAIDKNQFSKQRYFLTLIDDWGISVARKRK